MSIARDRSDSEATDRSSWSDKTLESINRLLESARRGRGSDSTFGPSTASVEVNRLDETLREVDRLWRCSPSAPGLAALYGHLLSLEGRDFHLALHLLERVAEPDDDVIALRVQALQQLRRGDDALQALTRGLTDHCVMPGGLLDHMAFDRLRHSDQASGWIGRGPRLEVVGGLREEAADAVQVTLDTGATFVQPIETWLQQGQCHFRFRLPDTGRASMLDVSVRDVPLLGSGCPVAVNFRLDGRASSRGRTVEGWVRVAWWPAMPIVLALEDPHGNRHELPMKHATAFDGRRRFSIRLGSTSLRGSRIHLTARLADGQWHALPDSPLLLGAALRLRTGNARRLPQWAPDSEVRPHRGRLVKRAPVDVVIPVYRGLSETLRCIDSVRATLTPDITILVIDDASDDSALAAELRALDSAGHITLLRNPSNLGFAATVNRAFGLNPHHDVILLNSDTVVVDDWLPRLRDAAYSAAHIGTVTPFSNNGSIASYPRSSDDPMDATEARRMHALASAVNAGIRAPIPVGVGFCLYVRRDCLAAVGNFDAAVFDRGYGEETDFCLRARQCGWSHLLAADVFVYHAGARSFGGRREALLDRSQRLVRLRHPGYDRFIESFLAVDPLRVLRRQLDQRRLLDAECPFFLIVTMALTGGVTRFVAARCKALRAQGLFPLLLRPQRPGALLQCELWTEALDVPNLRYTIPADLDELRTTLRALSIKGIEIEHFLHLDARVIETVRQLDVPYDVVIHDYGWICPRVTLIDHSGRYCGEPAVTVCELCVKRNGSYLGERITVAALRKRSAVWLGGAREVVTHSNDTARRMARYVDRRLVVRNPPSEVMSAPPRRPRNPQQSRLRVALIGALGDHKGYRVLLDCARDARARNLPIEFILIGFTENDSPLLKTGRVFVTGQYNEGEALTLVRREHPDLVLMPSVWPETWCYTLDYALAEALPVVAFEIGAIAERLRAAHVGRLLPITAMAPEINDLLLEYKEQTSPARPRDTAIMQERKEKPMMNPVPGAMPKQHDPLSASIQILPLPPGLYLFSVKAANTSSGDGDGDGKLRVPALHVGLGPGVRADQVEFTAGPQTEGAWLFAKEDCLVAKVKEAGTTLVLTSVRGVGGELLSIKVERLDSRDANPSVAPPVAAPPAPPTRKTEPKIPSPPASTGPVPLAVQISLHIRSRGDLVFREAAWAGRVATGLWIESFSIRPLEKFGIQDIEYKGLTGSGFETPWLSDAAMCGTKGMAVPLVGFAIRLKPGREAAAYDCEYSGFFKSGATVGPLLNGIPCRSTVANDPLEGIQLRIVKRSSTAARPAPEAPRHRGTGPSFGRYRDENASHPSGSNSKGTLKSPPHPPPKTAKAGKKTNGSTGAGKRSNARRP